MKVSLTPPKSETEAEPIWLPFYVTRGEPTRRPRRGPSLRNREIYAAVMVAGKSGRDTAKQFQLSHTRVQQIVRQVESWIAATNGGRRGTAKSRLTVAEELHHARLNHLFGVSLAEFEASRGELRVSKCIRVEGKPERREVTIKSRSPDPRHLVTALKIEESLWAFTKERLEREEAEELSLPDRQQEVVEVLSDAAELKHAAERSRPVAEAAQVPAELTVANANPPPVAAAQPTAEAPVVIPPAESPPSGGNENAPEPPPAKPAKFNPFTIKVANLRVVSKNPRDRDMTPEQYRAFLAGLPWVRIRPPE